MGPVGNRFALYHRISQVNGREANVNEEDARRLHAAWCTMRGKTPCGEYIDRDVSGSKMDRPELNRMLDDLKAGRIDGIFVAWVDRLSRADVGDALKVVKEILDIAPGCLVLNDLGVDPTTEMGEFCLTVLLGLARMQWRRYARQWKTAQNLAREAGVHLGRTPLGYRKERVLVGERTRNLLVLDDETAPVVRRAYVLASTDGLHAALWHLAEHAPERSFKTTDDVRRLLRQEVYKGAGNGPAIVNAGLWAAAQIEARNRARNSTYPLSGLAFCEVGELTGGIDRVGQRRYRTAVAGGTTINADKLEDLTRKAMEFVLGDQQFRDSFDVADVEQAIRRRKAAEDELERYLGDMALRRLNPAAHTKGAAPYQLALDKAIEVEAQAASTAGHVTVMPHAGELDDPEVFARSLRFIGRIEVSRGTRSRDITSRVRFVFDNGFVLTGDEVAGALAA